MHHAHGNVHSTPVIIGHCTCTWSCRCGGKARVVAAAAPPQVVQSIYAPVVWIILRFQPLQIRILRIWIGFRYDYPYPHRYSNYLFISLKFRFGADQNEELSVSLSTLHTHQHAACSSFTSIYLGVLYVPSKLSYTMVLARSQTLNGWVYILFSRLMC